MPEITKIKQLAKKLKKELSITHGAALEKIVKNMGYQSWNHYCAMRKEK